MGYVKTDWRTTWEVFPFAQIMEHHNAYRLIAAVFFAYVGVKNVARCVPTTLSFHYPYKCIFRRSRYWKMRFTIILLDAKKPELDKQIDRVVLKCRAIFSSFQKC